MAKLAYKGGEKACNFQWPTWPQWDDRERQGLMGVLESGKWWYGEKVKEFEAQFAAFQGAKYGITAFNGTVALEAAFLAHGIGAGDEVIVPPYTFMATASAVQKANAIPIFADILPDSLCIDPDDVERKITPKTRAICPVHVGGFVVDMDRLGEIARKHNLLIIEDACHAWGSQWRGKGTGTLGNSGVFSFQASKNIASSEGGIILTDDKNFADLCRSYTNCGRQVEGAWYEHFLLGSNLRMTEFQAALLLAQLSRLEEQILKRQSNAAILREAMRDIPGIHVLGHDERMTRRSYHFYPFRLDLEYLGVGRQTFIDALAAEGVPSTPGYSTPLYKNPLFQHKGDGPKFCPVSCPYYGQEIDYTKVSCPVCEKVVTDTMWFKHPLLLADEEAMLKLADAVRKVCENVGELR